MTKQKNQIRLLFILASSSSIESLCLQRRGGREKRTFNIQRPTGNPISFFFFSFFSNERTLLSEESLCTRIFTRFSPFFRWRKIREIREGYQGRGEEKGRKKNREKMGCLLDRNSITWLFDYPGFQERRDTISDDEKCFLWTIQASPKFIPRQN